MLPSTFPAVSSRRLSEPGGWILRPADAAAAGPLPSDLPTRPRGSHGHGRPAVQCDISFNHLRSQALNTRRSRTFIRDVIKEIR